MVRECENRERDMNTQTQGATQSQAESVWAQFESQQIDNIVWGRLYGKNVKIKSLDLINDEFSAGRGEGNDLTLTIRDLPQNILCRISKTHFVIKRANCDLSNPVYIQDLSRNGTFLNGSKIGTQKTRILQNDDVVAIAHPTYKAFVFKDLSPNEAHGLPKEITATYYISRKLGSGACGVVRLVYDKTTCQEYAMKIVEKNMLAENAKSNNMADGQRVMNEANIMKSLSHPCVIKMHDIVDTPDSVYMVLEFMKGGDLLTRIISKKRLSEKTSKFYFFQMCLAVKYLHDKGITHRDLKPDNVLLETTDEETLLKVSDFGLSKFVQKDSVMRTLCGTPLYVAPEVLLTGGRGTYTKKVDIWGLGVMLYSCLSGTLPFSDDYGTQASEQIKKGHFTFKHSAWKTVSQRAQSLIKTLLIVDPQRRPNIDEVLENSWLKDSQMLKSVQAVTKIETMDIDEENFLEPPAKRKR